jgi:hypothetical protein
MTCTAVTHGHEHLEYMELWELPPGVDQEALGQAWSTVIEEWQPVLAAADLNWGGSEFAVLRGERARRALIVLQPHAATSAVLVLFGRWHEDRDERDLVRAQQIADEAVATMHETGLSDVELGGELSGMLSRVGFLKSFDNALLDDARTALEDALRTGDGDEWVTHWNLANVAARQGDADSASAHLDDAAEGMADFSGKAFVLFYVPGRSAADCLVSVTDAGTEPLLDLQRAVIAATPDGSSDLGAIVERCRTASDPGVAQAADWVAASLATTP